MLKRSMQILLALILLFPIAAVAMDGTQQQRYDQIMEMKMAQLTEAAEELLEQKFPGHDWDQYNFPDYVFLNNSIEMGYRVAVVAPKLLGKLDASAVDQGIPCYCFCFRAGWI